MERAEEQEDDEDKEDACCCKWECGTLGYAPTAKLASLIYTEWQRRGRAGVLGRNTRAFFLCGLEFRSTPQVLMLPSRRPQPSLRRSGCSLAKATGPSSTKENNWCS